MRKLLLAAWCLAPVGAWTYHMGPGQDLMRQDEAAVHLARGAERASRAAALAARDGDDAALDDWIAAAEAYGAALELLPGDRVASRRRATLERAKAQMEISELPEANRVLRGLVDELLAEELDAARGEGAPEVDSALRRDAQRALASSEYYMTWLSRLEGRPRDEWLPRIESARQVQRRLVDEARAAGDDAGMQIAMADLESVIRLERMDLSELQGLPLPSQ